MVSLVIQAEGDAPRSRELTAGTITVGRKSDNDIRLDDGTVSGHHAKIVTYFGASYVEDLGSTNGTYVNGRRVRIHTLRPGDVVTIGRHTLAVRDEALAPTSAAAPQAPQHTVVISTTDLQRALAQRDGASAHPVQAGAAAEPVDRPAAAGVAGAAPSRSAPAGAYLRVMAGPNTGERIYLGARGAALERGVSVTPSGRGYVLGRAGSDAVPVRLNSRDVGPDPVPLKDMDMLQVGSAWLAFFAG